MLTSNDPIVLPSLGRNIRVGDCYNYYTDTIIESTNEVEHQAACEYKSESTLAINSHFLNLKTKHSAQRALRINTHLKMNMENTQLNLWFSGFLDSAFPAVANTSSTDEHAQVFVYFRIVDGTKYLKESSRSSIMAQYNRYNCGRATHLVEQVVYGAEMIIAMSRKISHYETKEQEESDIYSLAERYFNSLEKGEISGPTTVSQRELERLSFKIYTNLKEIIEPTDSFQDVTAYLKNLFSEEKRQDHCWQPLDIVLSEIKDQLDAKISNETSQDIENMKEHIDGMLKWMLKESRIISKLDRIEYVPMIASVIGEFRELLKNFKDKIHGMNWAIEIGNMGNPEKVSWIEKVDCVTKLVDETIQWFTRFRSVVSQTLNFLKDSDAKVVDFSEIECILTNSGRPRAQIFILKVDYVQDALMQRLQEFVGKATITNFKMPILLFHSYPWEKRETISQGLQDFIDQMTNGNDSENPFGDCVFYVGLVPPSSSYDDGTIQIVENVSAPVSGEPNAPLFGYDCRANTTNPLTKAGEIRGSSLQDPAMNNFALDQNVTNESVSNLNRNSNKEDAPSSDLYTDDENSSIVVVNSIVLDLLASCCDKTLYSVRDRNTTDILADVEHRLNVPTSEISRAPGALASHRLNEQHEDADQTTGEDNHNDGSDEEFQDALENQSGEDDDPHDVAKELAANEKLLKDFNVTDVDDRKERSFRSMSPNQKLCNATAAETALETKDTSAASNVTNLTATQEDHPKIESLYSQCDQDVRCNDADIQQPTVAIIDKNFVLSKNDYCEKVESAEQEDRHLSNISLVNEITDKTNESSDNTGNVFDADNAVDQTFDIVQEDEPPIDGRICEWFADEQHHYSQLIRSGQPRVLQLNAQQDPRRSSTEFPWFHIGLPSKHSSKLDFNLRHHKVIILMGATGCGKSTLINGMVNYMLGVRWDDPFRFKVIQDGNSNNLSQSHSQTNCVTTYTIHHRQGMAVPYSMTIIDTPGYGDTRGLEKDKENTQNIHRFLADVETPIDQIHAVCFVAASANARLTHTQRYVIDSVFAVFGKGIRDNVRLLVTFADNADPPVVDACRAGHFPVPPCGDIAYSKFNSSVLYACNEAKQEEEEEDGGESFDELFWDMGQENFEKFFAMLENMEGCDLVSTRQVIQQRRQVQKTLKGIEVQLDSHLALIEKLEELQMNVRRRILSTEATNDDRLQQLNEVCYQSDELNQCVFDLNIAKSNVLILLEELSRNTEQLGSAALRSSSFTVADYLCLMRSRVAEAQAPGYVTRLATLDQLQHDYASRATP